MARQKLIPLIVCALMATPAVTRAADDDPSAARSAGSLATWPAWPVSTSLRATIGAWARRCGWPAPQYLTDADWPVDVPGSIPGSIEQALTVLAEGFGSAAARPRIVISANHVIVVSEFGGDR
jgi:hypothetical protein